MSVPSSRTCALAALALTSACTATNPSSEACDDDATECGAHVSEVVTKPWTFVSIPDFLNADIGDVSHLTSAVNSTNAAHEAAINRVLDAIAAEKPDFVLVAGDLVNGHWHSDASDAQVFGPVRTLAEKRAAVAIAGDVYYAQWKERFAARGLTVYPAVGDHDVGDNNWSANSDKAFLVADFKAAFAKHFTLDAGGQPLFDQRPVGTPYEHTSYAVRHKNLLIVTMDEFRQDDPTLKIDGTTGSVRNDVVGDHLAWLDRVLTKADGKPQIKHVIVQGHIPVLTPVRRQNSSGLTFRGGADSEFWKTLVKHQVDLYFAGEVHDMTSGNHGGVEQVVHGGILGYAPNANYLVGKVYPDRIELELKRFDLVYPTDDTSKLWQAGSNRPRAQYSIPANPFASAGTLVVDKSSGSTVYANRTGYFVPLDAPPGDGLAVHLSFDEQAGSTTAINGGTAGAVQNGVIQGATYVAGKLGNAVAFDALDKIVAGPSPIVGSAARTTSVWVRLPGPSTAIRTAFHIGVNSTGRKWDVDIDATGKFEIGIAGGRVDSASSPTLTDGKWHNLTAVVPEGVTNLAGIKLYVDGKAIPFTAPATPVINTASDGKLILGVSANASVTQQYSGDLDDLAIWNRPLGAVEVRAMVSLANTAGLQYDAGKVDALLTAFDDATDAEIDGRTWKYQAAGLTGTAGTVVTTAANQYELHLGGGAGLVLQAP